MWDLCEIKSKPWLSVTTFCIWLTHILTFCFCVLCLFFKGGPFIQPLMCDLLFTSRVTALRDQSTSWERQLKRCSEASGKSNYYMRHEHISPHFWKFPHGSMFNWKMYQRRTSSFKPFSSCGKLVLRQTWCFCSLDSQRWSHVFGVPWTAKMQRPGGGAVVKALATNSGTGLGWFRVPWGKC